jgi:hypothetical protein
MAMKRSRQPHNADAALAKASPHDWIMVLAQLRQNKSNLAPSMVSSSSHKGKSCAGNHQLVESMSPYSERTGYSLSLRPESFQYRDFMDWNDTDHAIRSEMLTYRATSSRRQVHGVPDTIELPAQIGDLHSEVSFEDLEDMMSFADEVLSLSYPPAPKHHTPLSPVTSDTIDTGASHSNFESCSPTSSTHIHTNRSSPTSVDAIANDNPWGITTTLLEDDDHSWPSDEEKKSPARCQQRQQRMAKCRGSDYFLSRNSAMSLWSDPTEATREVDVFRLTEAEVNSRDASVDPAWQAYSDLEGQGVGDMQGSLFFL